MDLRQAEIAIATVAGGLLDCTVAALGPAVLLHWKNHLHSRSLTSVAVANASSSLGWNSGLS